MVFGGRREQDRDIDGYVIPGREKRMGTAAGLEFIVGSWKWSLWVAENYLSLYLYVQYVSQNSSSAFMLWIVFQIHPMPIVSFLLTQIIATPYVTAHRTASSILQKPLFLLHLIALDLVTNLELIPTFEAHTALAALPSFGDIFLDVLQTLKVTCILLVFSPDRK